MNTTDHKLRHRIAAKAACETMGAMRTAYPKAFGQRQDALAPMHGEMTA